MTKPTTTKTYTLGNRLLARIWTSVSAASKVAKAVNGDVVLVGHNESFQHVYSVKVGDAWVQA
jgi:hypothetical protein